jgi:hypothetical protein
LKVTGSQLAINFSPDVISLLLQWDSLYPFTVKRRNQALLIWGMLPKFILWNLWLERNHIIFRESQRNEDRVVIKIQSLLGESSPHLCSTLKIHKLDEEKERWIDQFKIQGLGARKESDPIQENWEIMKSEKEFASWKRKIKTHILFFDGALKGDPGQAGGGGIIENLTESTAMRFAIGLGIESNNRAEVVALWQGLHQAIKLRI